MAEEKSKESKKWVRKLRNKYRLVLMNDETYEEKFSFRLSPMNVFTWGGSLFILIVVAVLSLVAFTPVREFIPGYADVNLRRNAMNAVLKADSLERELLLKDQYLNNIALILEGKVKPEDLSRTDSVLPPSHLVLARTREDSILRAEIENQDKYNITLKEGSGDRRSIANYFLFPPIKGVITASYNSREQHYGTDIAAPENEAVKSTLDGTVVMSSWTSDDGYVMQIQHSNNIISVYKHNSVLLKKTGDFVKTGEAIAIVGNTGEHSYGPHLHFELWHNGNPVDPQTYIQFD